MELSDISDSVSSKDSGKARKMDRPQTGARVKPLGGAEANPRACVVHTFHDVVECICVVIQDRVQKTQWRSSAFQAVLVE